MSSWIRINNAKNRGSFPPYPTRLACSLKRKTFTDHNLRAVSLEDKPSNRAGLLGPCADCGKAVTTVRVCYDLVQTEGRQWQQKSQGEVSSSQVLTLLPSSSSLWQIFTSFQNLPRKILYSVDKIFQVAWKIFLSPLNTALYILNQRVN